MRNSRTLSLFFWGIFAHFTLANDDNVAITDIEEFSLLPSCAADGVTWAVGEAAASASCGEHNYRWQSCLCSNTKASKRVIEVMTGQVTFGCGESASADLSSASVVFAKYCDSKVKVDFSAPATDNVVDAYITDIREIQYLAPCAARGLSGAVMTETKGRCPEAPSLLAPCVCGKSGVADDVSDNISRSVKTICSNKEDVTSALSFFEGYCDMTNGTSSFAKLDGPKGDMTYHITALEQFQSLDECAQSGLSAAVLGQTELNCPSDSQALASCACVKTGMKVSISSDVTAEVKGYCASGALDGISSALDVLDLYCSAAEDKVVPTIVESTSETSDPPETGTSSASVATETGTPNDNDNSAGGANKTAIIAGAVVGGVIALALLLGLGIFIRRKQKKPKNKSPPKISAPHEYNGMPELIGSHGNDSTTEIIKAAFPAPTTPESDYYPGRPELGGSKGVVTELPSGMYKPYRPPELQGDIAATQMPSASPIPKMPSPGTLAEMDAEEVPHMNKELPPSPMLSKYNKTCGRNSPATVCDSNIPAPLSSMNTGGSNASRWRQQEPVSEVFEMEANPVHKG